MLMPIEEKKSYFVIRKITPDAISNNSDTTKIIIGRLIKAGLLSFSS